MDGDHVHIGGPALVPNTSSLETYKDLYRTSKIQNTGLSPFAADNIRGTHFKIGNGGFVSQTEQNSKFQ
jgi:hypothetical protein